MKLGVLIARLISGRTVRKPMKGVVSVALRRALKVIAPIVALGAGVAWMSSIRKQRRNPEPFPASQARLLDNPLARKHAEKIVTILDLAPGMRVLDVGAGVGRLSIPIAKAVEPGGEVVALDIQQDMLDILEKRAADEDVGNIQTIRAAAGSGVIEKDEFDRAILVTVLGEIPHERRNDALIEMREGLKREGKLYVVETLGDPHYQSRAAVIAQGQEAGFTPGTSHRFWAGHLTELRRA